MDENIAANYPDAPRFATVRLAASEAEGRRSWDVGPQERDRSPVEDRLGALSAAVSSLTEAVALLGKRLTPVLRPPRPTEAVDSDGARVVASPVVEQLDSQLDRVAQVEFMVVDLMGRLEL